MLVSACITFCFFSELELDNAEDFPGGTVAKNVLASVGCTGSIPDPGRCLIAIKPMGHNY